MNDLIIRLVLPTLLPIIPAFILFKYLPSKANVKGEIRHVKFNLYGSFGAYFLLAWVLLADAKSTPSNPERYEDYTVTGVLSFGGQMVPPDLDTQFWVVMPRIPTYQVNPANANFSLTLPILTRNGKPLVFPSVIVEHAGFTSRSFDLSKATLTGNTFSIAENPLELDVSNTTGAHVTAQPMP